MTPLHDHLLALGFFAAVAGADAPQSPAAEPGTAHPGMAFVAALGGHVSLLIALFGFGLLMFLLAPERHRLAVQVVRTHPIRSFALGVILLLPAAVGLIWILHHTLALHGRGALAVYLLISSATGLSVCARALAERVAPDSSAATQTPLGLVAMVAPLASVLGLSVLLIGAPLGLGAWVTARWGRPRPP